MGQMILEIFRQLLFPNISVLIIINSFQVFNFVSFEITEGKECYWC